MRSGFTIVRNGDALGYPYLESLRTLAPLVDEIVVAHGDSTDTTLASLQRLEAELPCRLRIIDSPWDSQSLRGGLELSRQTNVALDHCAHEICVYLQADELFHEAEHELAREDLERFAKDTEVDGLAFRWLHFYGNFFTIVRSRKWYRREVRAVKKSSGIRSVGDAQGFRMPGERKPRAALSRAHVHHYGWVRPPETMARKSESLDRLWHGSARDGSHSPATIYQPQFGQQLYAGTHPTAILWRVEEMGAFDPFKGKDRPWNTSLALGGLVERWTDWRPGEHKNYRRLKKY